MKHNKIIQSNPSDSQRMAFELRTRLGETIIKRLESSNAILAGGALASILSNNQINDFDIFFRNRKDFDTFNGSMSDHILGPTTDNAITYHHCTNFSIPIQAISRIFGDTNKILNSFDFVACMIAYDFKTKSLWESDYFAICLKHKLLDINPYMENPLGSMMRIEKYIQRGYKMQSFELVKLGILCSRSPVYSIEDVPSSVLKFYGDSDCFNNMVKQFLETLKEKAKSDFDIIIAKHIGGE